MSVRDQHRSGVYTAEQQVRRILDRATSGSDTVEFYGSVLTIPVERRFGDLDSVQRYVDLVMASGYVTDRWGTLPSVSIRKRQGTKKAHWQYPNTIAIPTDERWALREVVVLHEVAHHINHYAEAGNEFAVHGPEFTAVYLDLLSQFVGPEVALLTRAAFDGGGVPVAAPH